MLSQFWLSATPQTVSPAGSSVGRLLPNLGVPLPQQGVRSWYGNRHLKSLSPCTRIHPPVILHSLPFKQGLPIITNNVLLRVSTSSLSIWWVCSHDAAPRKTQVPNIWALCLKLKSTQHRETEKGYPQGKTCLGTSHRSRQTNSCNEAKCEEAETGRGWWNAAGGDFCLFC